MLQPQRFGRYLLTQKIATGGMAEIFLAKFFGTAGFEKDLVIKRILPQWSYNQEFIAMLIDEAKIAVQLNHANIVQVFELGKEKEAYYIAMEYVEGIDLRRVKKPPLAITLFVMTELLEGLAYAHQKKDTQGRPLQIVHRDISPQNILLSFDGAVKITDFGIAKAALKDHETMTGVLKGKFAYMSPEQAEQKVLDARTDLFAAGIILYELVTGERLFGGRGDLDTLDRVRRAQVSFSPSIEKSLDPRLRALILKSLSRQREDRFTSATEFRTELLHFCEEIGVRPSRQTLSRYLQEAYPQEVTSIQEQSKQRETKTRQFLSETRLLETVVEPITATVFAGQELTTVDVSFKPLHPHQAHRSKRVHPGWRWGVGIGLLVVAIFGLWKFFSPERPPYATIPVTQPRDLGKLPEGKLPLPVQTHQVMAAPPPPLTVIEKAPPATVILEPPKPPQVPSQVASKKEINGVGSVSIQAIPWGYVLIDGQGRSETPVQKKSLAAGTHRLEISYEPENLKVSRTISLKPNQHLFCLANFRNHEKTLTCGE